MSPTFPLSSLVLFLELSLSVVPCSCKSRMHSRPELIPDAIHTRFDTSLHAAEMLEIIFMMLYNFS
jgi:hypothetical protein